MGNARLHYWENLRREWLASNMSLAEFITHKGIKKSKAVYQQATRGGWHHQKASLEREIDRRVQSKIVKDGVKEWEEEIALLKGIRSHVAYILKSHVDKDGNVTKVIPAKELKELAEVVNKGVIAKKHIRGEPVDGEDSEEKTHFHLHAHMVKVVNEIEAEGPGPTPLTSPFLGHKPGG